ncbi:hypothetical protein [Streptomyces beijiangensis]|uniref:Uncharacterized protein n=2 Tax=Streptomyces beijiangensis TaxID=163361 RepID=A0A939FG87_9ACTN|nr:hypothetical protein [Streptomyces beijiangensis]MBO0516540.1 hypothetical protein [Streptomyces beijiangensis]
MLTVSKECRLLGGTEEYSALIGTPSAAKTVVLTLCTSGPASPLLADVRRAVEQAQFPGLSPTPGQPMKEAR